MQYSVRLTYRLTNQVLFAVFSNNGNIHGDWKANLTAALTSYCSCLGFKCNTNGRSVFGITKAATQSILRMFYADDLVRQNLQHHFTERPTLAIVILAQRPCRQERADALTANTFQQQDDTDGEGNTILEDEEGEERDETEASRDVNKNFKLSVDFFTDILCRPIFF